MYMFNIAYCLLLPCTRHASYFNQVKIVEYLIAQLCDLEARATSQDGISITG